MQQMEPLAELAGTGLSSMGKGAVLNSAGLGNTGLNHAASFEGMERMRLDSVKETLATLSCGSESLRGIAHDARNMVTALGLYCELLEEPGVLSPGFAHYGSELRLVASASRRLVEKLVALETQRVAEPLSALPPQPTRSAGKKETGEGQQKARRWDLSPTQPISNLAADLAANRNLLATLAGPGVALTMTVQGGAKPVRLTCEDLTRVLVNLVKNASEAMVKGGNLHISLCESTAAGKNQLTLIVEDNGPGIPEETLDKIFDSGYTTRITSLRGTSPGGTCLGVDGVWPATHRGLGLSITRSILEAAGGRITVSNLPQGGARFQMELPVRSL